MPAPTEAQQQTAEQSVEAERRAAFVRGLRELAECLERTPEIPVPYGTLLNCFVGSREHVAQIARTGPWQKRYVDTWFTLTRDFAGGVRLDVNVERVQVCERVVVGTETVPAQPAHEVEIVEWRCADSLLAPEAA